MSSEEEKNNQEIVIISDDDMEEQEESPMVEEGETSQRRSYRQRRHAIPYKWTLLDDWKLVELVCIYIHSSYIWKEIAAKFSPRSSDSCRVRWTKLLRCDDRSTQSRWSELANYLTMTREDLTSLWSQRISAKNSQSLPSTSSVPDAGSMIPNRSPANGEEEIMGGDEAGETSTTAIGPSSQGTSVFPALDLNVSLDPNHNQTPSSPPSTPPRPFYNFLGVDSE